MKLSEKGLEKIQQWQSAVALGFPMNPNEIDFQPDDFQDTVVLTVEEAKRLHDCAMFFWDDYEGTKYFTDDDERFLIDMKERIEQAEMSKQST